MISSLFFLKRSFIHFLSVARKKTESKERARNRPELRGRMSDFPNHSMNSLRSNSISYFVALIVLANQRLNIDSENPTYSKDLFVRNVFENYYFDLPSQKGFRPLLNPRQHSCVPMVASERKRPNLGPGLIWLR